MELAYTSDLKSDARFGLMGSSPIGATIVSPLFSGEVTFAFVRMPPIKLNES